MSKDTYIEGPRSKPLRSPRIEAAKGLISVARRFIADRATVQDVERAIKLWDESQRWHCLECGALAVWVRHTQFSGDHPYCQEHAQREKNFGQENPSYFVWRKIGET